MVARFGRRSLVAGAAVLSVAGLGRPSGAALAMGFDEARHLLSRATFGGTPEEIRAIARLDYAVAIDKLLRAQRNDPLTATPPWVGEGLAALERSQRESLESKDADGKSLKPADRPIPAQARELRSWWVEEMVATDQPLVERMTLFWHNHFTSSLDKVRYAPAMYRQNRLFRREAFGNFGRLLRAVAADPAMLIYLDGVRSVARQPNENFARELLELFTLGEGHYAEVDIRSAARAFTGWSIDHQTGAFRANPLDHDPGEKTFLGYKGRFGGDDILSILLKHPRTAELIVEKLWREFISFHPDPDEVTRLAGILRNGNYEMKPVLRALFLSPAFREPANRGALIKSPVDLIVGSVRMLGLPVPEKAQLVRMLQGLGQLPFNPPNVKGWAGGEAWITTYTLLLRQQFLRRMVEATTVSSLDGNMGPMRMTDGPRPVEGRSLRNAGMEAHLGPTLSGLDVAELTRVLLPRRPVDEVETNGSPGSAVAAAMLDPAYQLK